LDIKLDKLFGHYRIWIMIIKRNKWIRSILNNELWLLKWVYEIKVYSIGCEKRNLNMCQSWWIGLSGDYGHNNSHHYRKVMNVVVNALIVR
jgi:hypothetical protein